MGKKIIILIFGNLRMLFKRIVSFGKLKFNIYNNVGLSAEINISGNSKVVIGKKFIMRNNSYLAAHNGGGIAIGKNVFINRNCYIVSHEKIVIKDNVSIGPNTVIVDHDHEFDALFGVNRTNYKTNKIIINDGVWIGANCVILKGIEIGKNSVIAAGSVINFDVPENTIIVQKKNTKQISIK